MTDTIHKHDVVIIGGGLTGLRAAIELAEAGFDVALVSKVHPLRSHSVAAQGGINAALGNAPEGRDDSWERHAFDTVKGSDFLADQNAVAAMCQQAARAVYELEHMGTVFSRFEDGRIAQRPFGGAGFPRTCYAADRTGHNLLHTLYEQVVACGLQVYEEFFVTALAKEDGRCIGCTALDIASGELHGFAAKATLLATGGYGRIFARSTNAVINTGDGAALALQAGCPLEDMEFVQFHPTTLFGTNILITEGARGEGGYLFNKDHIRFMQSYAAEAMELAPRDIVARAIQTEVDEGRGFEGEYVQLDLTHLGAEKVKTRLPGIRQIAMDFAGIDPVEQPIPVQPGQHYSMGGVASSVSGATPMPGLYAAGECACISVHGANRLGGNSLLETVVFGRLAGAAIADKLPSMAGPDTEAVKDTLSSEKQRVASIRQRDVGERYSVIRDELNEVMFRHFGVFRDAGSMRSGLEELATLGERSENLYIDSGQKRFNQALVHALEVENMVLIALAVGLGAAERKESRGAHFRRDFPRRRDDRFLKHTIALLGSAGIELSYAEVGLGRFEVQDRKY